MKAEVYLFLLAVVLADDPKSDDTRFDFEDDFEDFGKSTEFDFEDTENKNSNVGWEENGLFNVDLDKPLKIG